MGNLRLFIRQLARLVYLWEKVYEKGMITRFCLKSALSHMWWVIALLMITYVFYLQSIKKKKMIIAHMSQRIEVLEEEKKDALARQENLKLQIASQGDPAWVEMVLMKELGMVPDGQRKVHFTK